MYIAYCVYGLRQVLKTSSVVHVYCVISKTRFENFLNDLTYTINAALLQSGTHKKVNYNLEVSITSEFVVNDVIIQWEYGDAIGGEVRLDAKGLVFKTTTNNGSVEEKKRLSNAFDLRTVPLLTLYFPRVKRKCFV